MRKFGFLLAGALFFMATIALVEGQQPGKKGGFGGGFGNNPFTLLTNAEVKKDLDVTDEQMEKLPAEMLTAISRVLNEKQFSRFKQIQLQQKRNGAFKDAAVQKQLNLTADQKKSIDSIIEDESKELVELFKGGGKGGFGKGATEKTDKVRAEAKEKIYTVLNKDQRKTWREMIGTELKISFTGGFGGKKGAKKKTDQ